MDNKTIVLDVMRNLGEREATELRKTASTLTGTEIIAQERSVPPWDAQQDYTGWLKGAPVTDEGQVWTLITPHRAADYQGGPPPCGRCGAWHIPPTPPGQSPGWTPTAPAACICRASAIKPLTAPCTAACRITVCTMPRRCPRHGKK